MWDALQNPTVRVGVGLAVLAVVISIAIWFVKRFRDHTTQDHLDPEEVLGNFAEMQRRGDINEDEFRTIKAAMSFQTRRNLDQSSKID